MTITTKPITKENEIALSLPNDPFPDSGRIEITYDGEGWKYKSIRYAADQIKEQCFPDEGYIFDEMGDGFHGIAAYDGNVCIGFAVLYESWNKYLMIDNLLVPKKYRRNGVGRALVNASMELAKGLGKLGVRLVCQDNNLEAFNFYIANGFEVGGYNNRDYDGTSQQGKGDIFLYKNED